MGDMAFRMLERNTNVFFEEEVTECGLNLKEVTVFSGLCTELPSAPSGRRTFCFIHFTFQVKSSPSHTAQDDCITCMNMNVTLCLAMNTGNALSSLSSRGWYPVSVPQPHRYTYTQRSELLCCCCLWWNLHHLKEKWPNLWSETLHKTTIGHVWCNQGVQFTSWSLLVNVRGPKPTTQKRGADIFSDLFLNFLRNNIYIVSNDIYIDIYIYICVCLYMYTCMYVYLWHPSII